MPATHDAYDPQWRMQIMVRNLMDSGIVLERELVAAAFMPAIFIVEDVRKRMQFMPGALTEEAAHRLLMAAYEHVFKETRVQR